MLRDRCPVSLSVTLVYCGRQTVGWIKIPLGMEVCLGPGKIVLDGDPASPPPRNGAPHSPHFSVRLLWPNGRRSQQLLNSFSGSSGHFFLPNTDAMALLTAKSETEGM